MSYSKVRRKAYTINVHIKHYNLIKDFLQVLCVYPRLIHPWPVAGIAIWLGLVQDLLIPIGLGIVDSRFCQWVSNVYRCSGKSVEEKLPHGKDTYSFII